MKLLYLVQYFGFPEYATGSRTYDLATSFVKQGLEVTVITSYTGCNGEPKWQIFQRDGIIFHRLNCPYNNSFGFWKRIKAFSMFMVNASLMALKIDCDIVLASSTPLTIGLPALVAHYIKRKPFVFEVRDVWPGVPIAMGYFKNPIVRKFLYLFEKLVYKKAEAIVPLSVGMDDNIKKRYPNEKSVVIPNISEINRFSHIKKRIDITVPDNKKVLLYAGTFGNVNGVSYIIRLAEASLKYSSDVWYYLVGSGKEKEDIIRLAKCLGVLEKNVFIFDPVGKIDLPYLYSIVTVGCSVVIDIPALWDNSASKFFDSLAAGRPIVINYEGWQADTIRQQNCGYILPSIITDKAVKDFVDYMTNDTLLVEQGKNALFLAKKNYSLEVAVAKYLRIFKSIISRDKMAS